MTPVETAKGLLRRHASLAGADLVLGDDELAPGALCVNVSAGIGGFALIERAAHPAEGGPTVRRGVVDVHNAKLADASIGMAVDKIAALQRRREQVGDAEPTWSFSVSSVTSAALNYLGIDPGSIAIPGPDAAWGRLLANAADVPGVDLRLVGSRLLARSILIPPAGRAPGISIDETIGLPALTISAPLPDSLVLGSAGRPLGDVIAHPALPVAPAIISMRQGSFGAEEVRLIVEDWRDPVGPCPHSPPPWLEAGARYRERPLFT